MINPETKKALSEKQGKRELKNIMNTIYKCLYSIHNYKRVSTFFYSINILIITPVNVVKQKNTIAHNLLSMRSKRS